MIKKINVKQLQKGMFICGTDRKWVDIPIFRRKFLINLDKEINILQEYCESVYIDTQKGVDVISRSEAKTIIEPRKDEPSDTSPENNSCKKVYDESQTILTGVLNDVRLGRSIDNPKIRGIVEELTVNIVKDSQAMIGLTRLKDKNDGLARKSVNVCILALAFGKHIGIPKDKMYTLGFGALLHDIGMVMIPNRILLKEQPLTTAERKIMEKHTEYGLTVLTQTPGIPVDVLKIVHSHHERMDGNGYPKKLQDKEISLLTRMVTLASVYEALTRERLYAETLSPTEALRHLYRSVKSGFDAHLVEKFIRMIGIYPLDCVVELNTGEVGVVADTHPQEPLRPVLRIVADTQKQLLPEARLLDLADPATEKIGIIKTLAKDDPMLELIGMHRRQSQDEAIKPKQ
ncbi:HD-GYP domain-containing protein [Methylobacter sp. Wu8]|uniref:HD-GYP domain-containing protein n=1 Tax=Methylobacter sp. Wu8 TaxID=3118457 RepID=UPI002F326197